MLVGRRRELGLLRGRPVDARPVVLVGEAGIGKTSLLRAVAEHFPRRSFVGGGLSTLGWVPYLPLTRALGDRGLNGDQAAAAALVRDGVGDGLLVLDDLHWADAETLSLLALLVGKIELLVAVRLGDPGTTRALAAVDAAGFEQFQLGRLDDDDALRLLEGARPDLGALGATRVLDGARGNPLLLLELAADGEPSPTLRVSLEARFRRCSPAAEEALALLALLGRAAGADLLGPGAAELVAAGLATQDDGCLSPRHALITEAAAARLEAARRRELHERLARELDEPGEAARHYEAAGLHELARARALEAAAATRRPGERAEHLRVAAACSSGQASDRLRLDAADALIEASRPWEALELAESVEGAGSVIRARACLARGRARWALEDARAATSAFNDGLAVADGEAVDVSVRLGLELVRVALWSGDPQIEESARTGLARAQDAGAHIALAHYLLGCALFYPVCSIESLEQLRSAYRQAMQDGDQDLMLEAMAARASAMYQVGGNAQAALQLAEEGARRARSLKARARESCFRWLAARLLGASKADYSHPIEEFRALLDEPLFGYPSRDQVAADLAIAFAHTGRTDEARAVLAREGRGGSTWWGRQALGEAIAEIELAAGQPDRAAAAAETALEEAVSTAVHFHTIARDFARLDLGLPPGPHPVDLPTDALSGFAPAVYEALSSFAEGRFEPAALLFDEAATTVAPVLRIEELRCRWAAGEAARRGGDVALALRHLLEVEERAAALDLLPLVARTRRSLRLAGERRSLSAARASNGSLTEREREVLLRVGAGETSKQIARRLGLAPATVDDIVKSSVAKLGARTRRQAAAIVARSTHAR